jgi:hypothetical protein
MINETSKQNLIEMNSQSSGEPAVEEVLTADRNFPPIPDSAQIARHKELKRRGMLSCALDGLDAKGILRHTDDRVERYYLVHTG